MRFPGGVVGRWGAVRGRGSRGKKRPTAYGGLAGNADIKNVMVQSGNEYASS